ncbi:MAG: methylenetetrahydrofolate reductase [NAD(P)H] [Pseudomonadota bacterium]
MTNFSFEYFPPRNSAQRERFKETHQRLRALKPEYFSVTFGAGGTTRDETADTVDEIRATDPVAPHISCRGGTEDTISALLDRYRAKGVDRLVVLRGDPTSGSVGGDRFAYACDLVSFIQQNYPQQFSIAVACYPEVHPEASSAAKDLAYFRSKVDAGASEAITQYFFNADAYFRFVDAATAAGVEVPIVPGIMPVTNYAQLKRFSDVCGAEIPRWMEARLRDFGDDKIAIADFGLEVVGEMCERLIAGGAPSLHFYTLNRAAATVKLIDALGLAEAS